MFGRIADYIKTAGRPSLGRLSGRWGKRAVVAVAFDDVAVRLLVAQRVGRALYVRHYDSEAVAKDVIVSGEIVDVAAAGRACARLFARLPMATKSLRKVATFVPSDAVMTRTLAFPAHFRDADIDDGIRADAERYIAFALDDVNYDFVALSAQSASAQPADEQQVLLVVAKAQTVQQCTHALAYADVQTDVVDVAEYALAQAFVAQAQQAGFAGKKVALIDIGRQKTQCYVADLTNVADLANVSYEQAFTGFVYHREYLCGDTDLTQDDFVKDDFTQNNSAKDGGAQDDFMQDSLEKNAVNTASAKPPENEWADGFKTSDFKATDFKATDFKATDFKENGFNANGFKTSDFELGDFNAKDLNFGSKVSPVNDLQQDNQWAALFSDTTTNSKTSTAIPSEPSQTSLSAQLDKAGLGDESSGGNHHDSHHGNHHANHSFTHLAFDDVARDGMMERLQNGAQASSVQSSRSFVNQFTDKSIEQSTASTSKADDDYVAMMTQQIATMLTHCAQAQQAVDVVLLCGSGRALDGLCAGVAKQTSKQTLIANPLAGVDFMQACAQVQADAPQLMALFGLAMRACDDS